MRFTSSIIRILLATTIALWVPLCMCERAGADVPAQPSSCCKSLNSKPHCQKNEGKKPCNHDGSCSCSKRDLYPGVSADVHTPPVPVLLFVLTWPSPIDQPIDVQVRATTSHVRAPAPRPATSLLRQHCALIV